MANMDIFNQDAFSTTSLVAAYRKRPFQPQFLTGLSINGMPLFSEQSARSKSVYIEEKDGALGLIQTSPRGTPLPQNEAEKRNVRGFVAPRIAKGDRVTADEVANIRAFGSESELMQVMQEVNERIDGDTGMMRDLELTWENMALGAVQGIVADADSTTLFNWFTEFGVAQDAEIAFDFANATEADVIKKANQAKRQMRRSAKGLWTPQTQVWALCGDNFWDDLNGHAAVRDTFKNVSAAESERLRNQVGDAFSVIRFQNIIWVNYQGTDDTTTVSVNTDKAKFFPAGSPGLFLKVWTPGEFFDVVNQPGAPVYPKIIPDEKRMMWVDVEVYSYPLFVATRPKMLQRARRGA